MRTIFLKKQHQKAIAILEMIAKNEERIQNKLASIRAYKKAGNQAWIRFPMFDLEAAKDDVLRRYEVDERLTTYYQNTISKLESIAELK